MSTPPQPFVFDFIRLLHQFQTVQRDMDAPDGHPENDMEHSYELAMVAWYVIEHHKLQLDTARVLMYALVHDLVEVYTGDINPLTATPHAVHQKPDNERRAAERLQATFWDVPGMHAAIHAYELKADSESRFVYVLDKFLPIMNTYLMGNWAYYKERGITEETWMAHTNDKLKKVDYATLDDGGFIDELLAFVQEKTDTLFLHDTSKKDVSS